MMRTLQCNILLSADVMQYPKIADHVNHVSYPRSSSPKKLPTKRFYIWKCWILYTYTVICLPVSMNILRVTCVYQYAEWFLLNQMERKWAVDNEVQDGISYCFLFRIGAFVFCDRVEIVLDARAALIFFQRSIVLCTPVSRYNISQDNLLEYTAHTQNTRPTSAVQ